MAANSPALTRAQALTQRILKSRPLNVPSHVFEGLASMGSTDSEIASLTRCTKDELDSMRDAILSGRARLKHSIRRAQVKAALKGNSSMLIWLGKMLLGQRESNEPTLSQQTNIVVDAKLLSALQTSYRATLADIRQAKDLSSPQDAAALRLPSSEHAPIVPRGTSSTLPDNHSSLISNHVKQPAFLADEPSNSARGTLGTLVTPEDTDEQYPNPNPAQLTVPQCTGYGTEPITSHNTEHVYFSPNPVGESTLSDNGDTHPPGGAPTPQTHPPSPQMPTSLLSEKFLGKGKLKNGRRNYRTEIDRGIVKGETVE